MFAYPTKTMLVSLALVTMSLMGCGKDKKDSKKNAPTDRELSPEVAGPDQATLPGTYVLVENRATRIVIDPSLFVSTNLTIPNPAGNDTRLTPRFPQALRYQALITQYATIGTYNDGTDTSKNVELRVKLDKEDRFLDVTLIIPPKATPEGAVNACSDSATQQNDASHQSDDPSQNPGKPWPCMDPKTFVYRYERDT
jgi:hypothetical protein